jgi:uncharacterized membrane protein
MTEQTYQNHAHRPYPTVVAGLFTVTAFILIVGQIFFGWETRDWALVSLVGTAFTLGLISRFYTVGLQDRIIMLEMKVRCAEMLPAGQDANLAKLSKKQIVALRFASDDELGALLERATRENLDPKAIKASIRTWRPDPHRT